MSKSFSKTVDEKGYCLSVQSKDWDWEKRSTTATCALCGEAVKVTSSGTPKRHKPKGK